MGNRRHILGLGGAPQSADLSRVQGEWERWSSWESCEEKALRKTDSTWSACPQCLINNVPLTIIWFYFNEHFAFILEGSKVFFCWMTMGRHRCLCRISPQATRKDPSSCWAHTSDPSVPSRLHWHRPTHQHPASSAPRQQRQSEGQWTPTCPRSSQEPLSTKCQPT